MEISFFEYTSADFDGYKNCLDGFYQGHHPYPEYFQQSFIDGLTERGELVLTLAKTEDGRVVGTSAAQRMRGTFEGSVLLGMRYVEPAYQGMGIGKNQELFLIDLVHKKFGDAQSVYADVVTNNDYSQKTLIRNGFCFCGINMMFYREPGYRSRYPEEDYKITMTVYAKAIDKGLRTLYPPDAYIPDIQSIYDDLGVPCRMCRGEAPQETAFTHRIFDEHSTAEFFITQAGTDHKALLDAVENALQQGNTLSAYLNIAKPGAELLCEKLEKRGFFFCGMKPLNIGSEYLIMCNTDNHRGDCRNIQIPPQNKQFLENILGGIQ